MSERQQHPTQSLDFESLLAQYHAEVWAAAEEKCDPTSEPGVGYDEAGRETAKQLVLMYQQLQNQLKPEYEEQPAVEADGCPTEGAVLKRFWRAQQELNVERQLDMNILSSGLAQMTCAIQESYDEGTLPKGLRYWFESWVKGVDIGLPPADIDLAPLVKQVGIWQMLARRRDSIYDQTSEQFKCATTLEHNARSGLFAECHRIALRLTFDELDFESFVEEQLGLSTRKLPNGDYQSFGTAMAHKAWWAGPKSYKPAGN